MRVYASEFAHAYSSYAFGYTLHAQIEAGDDSRTLYEQGFLPFSADPTLHDRFYMARSVRVPLAGWKPTSENRRILRKFDGVFAADILTRDELRTDAALKDCFLDYFADRHGQSIMSAARLDGILESVLPLSCMRYRDTDGIPVSYVLHINTPDFTHYWFSCHQTKYAGTSLGMWLMLDSVRRAQEEGRKHLYLGTAYGEKGRYKMNITPLEFWNGSEWNANEKLLKELIADDGTREVARS